jgi:hypothetical protein
VKLDVPDLLGEVGVPVVGLARACHAAPGALARLLRAVAKLGLVHETEPGTFVATEATALLRTGAPMREAVLLHGEEVFESLSRVLHTMRTGQPSFDRVFGQPLYDYLADSTGTDDTFEAALGQEPAAAAIAACGIGEAGVLVDVGGGNGSLLVRLLVAYPRLRGVLLDLPEAVQVAKERFVTAGVADRVECVEGSFFSDIPAGADVYLLSRVLSGWADRSATEILRGVRHAMPIGGRVLIREDLPPDADADAAWAAAVEMVGLVLLEACERDEAGYRRLLVAAGFDPAAIHRPSPGVLAASKL